MTIKHVFLLSVFHSNQIRGTSALRVIFRIVFYSTLPGYLLLKPVSLSENSSLTSVFQDMMDIQISRYHDIVFFVFIVSSELLLVNSMSYLPPGSLVMIDLCFR